VRTSVPDSNKCTAKAGRRECGLIFLWMLAFWQTSWQALRTAPRLMGWRELATVERDAEGLSQAESLVLHASHASCSVGHSAVTLILTDLDLAPTDTL
jgi:hypothetical protein